MVLKLVKVVLIAFDENGLIETIVAVLFLLSNTHSTGKFKWNFEWYMVNIGNVLLFATYNDILRRCNFRITPTSERTKIYINGMQ